MGRGVVSAERAVRADFSMSFEKPQGDRVKSGCGVLGGAGRWAAPVLLVLLLLPLGFSLIWRSDRSA